MKVSGRQGSLFSTFCSDKDKYFLNSNLLDINNYYNRCVRTSTIIISHVHYYSTIIIFVIEFGWMSEIINFDISYVKDNGLWRYRIENVKDNHFCVKLYQRWFFTFSNQEHQKQSFLIISRLKIMIIDVDK